MMRFLLILLLLPLPSAATQMSAADFEAYVTGKTLFYSEAGEIYGAEVYLPNRRVRWSFLDGECKDGYWYESGPHICFLYEDRPDPQCWSFELGPNGLIATFQSDPSDSALYEASDTDQELVCLGPKVGV